MSINQELAAVYREVARVMLYWSEPWFKVRSYIAFADTLDGLAKPISGMSEAEVAALPGVGQAILTKTRAYLDDGSFPLLDRVRAVDDGIREMLAADVPPAVVRKLEATGVADMASLRAAHDTGSLDTASLNSKQRRELREALA